MSEVADQTGGLPMFAEPKPKPTEGLHGLRHLAKLPREKCHCCGGNTNVYRRKLNSGMAATLCMMVSSHGTGWVHVTSDLFVSRVANISRNHCHLVHWGMTEAQPDESDEKNKSGVWRATDAGLAFVRGHARVPSHVFIRTPGNILLGVEDSTVNIYDALGSEFSYGELMRGSD